MGIKRATTCGVLVALGIVLIAAGESPYWWIGIGLLYVALGDAFLRLRGSASHRRFAEALQAERNVGKWTFTLAKLGREIAPLAIVLLGARWLYGPDRIFERVAQGDHAAHFAKALLIKEAFFETGTLFSWSHDWFAGFPLGYLYPVGGSLWILGVDALTLGLADFSQVYGLAVFSFFAAYGLAVYWVGRQAGGPMVGIVASLMAMADPGEGRAGGWSWAMQTGVWPNSLSMAFALVSLASARGVLRDENLRWVGLFAVALGASLLTHPMQLFFYGALAVSLAVMIAFMGSDERSSAAVRVGMAYALGLAIASFWYVPFLSVGAEFGFNAGAWWSPAWDMGEAIFDFTLIPGRGAGFTALALVGVFFAWHTKSAIARLAVGISLVLMATMNSSFVGAFHLPAWFQGLNFVQFIRTTIMVRPLFAVFAAITLVVAIRSLAERLPDLDRKRMLASAVVVTFFVPILAGFVDRLWNQGPMQGVTVESEWAGASDRADLAAYIHDELPDEPFYRIAYLWGSGSSKQLSFTTQIDKPWFKAMGGTPAVNFTRRVISRRGDVFAQTNVRYVVHDQPIKSGDYTLVKRFGTLRVYEFERWQREPFVVEGTGNVEVKQFDRERIVLEASDDASGELTLRVSAFPRWKATLDGTPAPIEYVNIPAHASGQFMKIPLAPGTIEFRFERTLKDIVSQVVGLLGLLLALVLLFGRPRWLYLYMVSIGSRARSALDAAASSRGSRLAALTGGGAIVVIALAIPRMDRPGNDTVFDFSRVDEARAVEIVGNTRRVCEPLFDRHLCRPGAWGHVASRPERIESRTNRRCVSAMPPARGALRVEYNEVPLGNTLTGHVGVPYPHRLRRGDRVDFAIEIDGTVVHQKRIERAQKTIRFDVATTPADSANIHFVFSSKSRPIPTCFFALSTMENE